jgi:hypothetical protein
MLWPASGASRSSFFASVVKPAFGCRTKEVQALDIEAAAKLD